MHLDHQRGVKVVSGKTKKVFIDQDRLFLGLHFDASMALGVLERPGDRPLTALRTFHPVLRMRVVYEPIFSQNEGNPGGKSEAFTGFHIAFVARNALDQEDAQMLGAKGGFSLGGLFGEGGRTGGTLRGGGGVLVGNLSGHEGNQDLIAATVHMEIVWYALPHLSVFLGVQGVAPSRDLAFEMPEGTIDGSFDWTLGLGGFF